MQGNKAMTIIETLNRYCSKNAHGLFGRKCYMGYLVFVINRTQQQSTGLQWCFSAVKSCRLSLSYSRSGLSHSLMRLPLLPSS